MLRLFLPALAILLTSPALRAKPSSAKPDWTAGLQAEVKILGKPSWRPMLDYDIQLHRASTHPATPPFEFPWEDTGRGYGYGPGFGHWDLVHEMIDVLPAAPEHAREQLLNDVRLQLPSGFLPGLYWMRSQTAADDPRIYDQASAKFSPTQTHPPVWVVAADDYVQQVGPNAPGTRALLAELLQHARDQLAWFERERRAQPDGFLYLDIVNHKWESGVDEGIRFYDTNHPNSTACVDATAHVYQEYVYAARWARLLGESQLAANLTTHADHLRTFMQTQLWDEKDSFFYDSWIKAMPAAKRPHSFEGMWPMIVGAATPQQAHRLIDNWLMRKDRFFTPHPIATVSASDPKFELRMWRGPVWNSMTYWAARGCVRYNRPRDAHRLLEAALDDTAAQFTRTGILWEFYSPFDAHPEDLKRKPQTKRNAPFPDYIGHNPLLAMARMWQATAANPAPAAP